MNTLKCVTSIANLLKYGGSAQKRCGPKLYSNELHYQPCKNVNLPNLPHPIFFGAQFAGTQFADKSVRGPICLEPKWKYQSSPNRYSTRFCTILDIVRQGLHEIDDDLVFSSLIISRNDLNIDVSSTQYCGYWWWEDESIIIFSEKPSKNPTTSVKPVYNSRTSGKPWKHDSTGQSTKM